MDEFLPKAIALLVVGLVIWGILRAAAPRPLFTVRVRNGEPLASHGHVTGAFLARVREVAGEHNVRVGLIVGVVKGDRIRVTFSGHFPPAAQQQLRNWWAEFGWPAPRPKRRR